jgi:hypothetical protein
VINGRLLQLMILSSMLRCAFKYKMKNLWVFCIMLSIHSFTFMPIKIANQNWTLENNSYMYLNNTLLSSTSMLDEANQWSLLKK